MPDETPAQVLLNEEAAAASRARAARALANSYRDWGPISIAWKQPNDFDRAMLLARLKGNLMDECPTLIEKMRREGISITQANLGSELMMMVGSARPRSRFVPWNVPDAAVTKMIDVVVAEWFVASKGSR
jgi:hypothetical protein